jgi:membrane-associated phospholipid phosphatase
MIAWSDISHFGDITITAIAALAIAGWLMAEGEKRLALCWTALFGTGLGIVVASKIAFIGWGLGIRALDFTGFSGHAMRATAVMPVLFYLILQKLQPSVRRSGAGLGLAFGVLVGISRVEVNAHSVSEAVAGVTLGAAISIGFLWTASKSLRRHVFNPLRIALSVIALLQAPYVHPAPTQQWLTSIALYVTGHALPFPRGEWRVHKPQQGQAES